MTIKGSCGATLMSSSAITTKAVHSTRSFIDADDLSKRFASPIGYLKIVCPLQTIPLPRVRFLRSNTKSHLSLHQNHKLINISFHRRYAHHSFEGLPGHPFSYSHLITSIRSFPDATRKVPKSQGYPFSRAHLSTSRCPMQISVERPFRCASCEKAFAKK